MTENKKSPLKIAIAGLGTVGANVVSLLEKNSQVITARAGRPIVVTAVSARDRKRERGIDVSAYQWHDDPQGLAKDPNVDLVVELMGGAEGAAYNLVKNSLAAGKAVVTANKALLASHANEVMAWQGENGILAYEAAVAGAIPAIKTLREGLSANEITSISGILNGTCNYILSEMTATGRNFKDVLKEAQDLGYAEADPSFDVDGIDAAHKLAILAGLAFGTVPDKKHVPARSITTVTSNDIRAAKDLEYRIRLLCIARKTAHGVVASVEPTLVHVSSLFASINGARNAVLIEGSHAGPIFLSGAGAGGPQTASAVVADIIDIARGHHLPFLGKAKHAAKPAAIAPAEADKGSYYISFGSETDMRAAVKPLELHGVSIENTAPEHGVLIVSDAHRAYLENAFKKARIFKVEEKPK